jgi:Protein of unknown function (DUF1638)
VGAEQSDHARAGVIVLACGALARELKVVLAQLGPPEDRQTPVEVRSIEVKYLSSALHNRPEQIPGEVDRFLEALGEPSQAPRIVLGYADCGTGGLLDALIERRRVQGFIIDRLPGAHCYEFFSGSARFAELTEQSLGTFYLTDYLALHFESLVWTGLGLDRHPELRDMYFGNYDRVALISQSEYDLVRERAIQAAHMLGLTFEHHHIGLVPFAEATRTLLLG